MLLALLACGGGESEPADATKADSPGSAQQGTPQAGNVINPANARMAQGEIPEGFPEDIPIPGIVEPVNALIIPDQGGLVTFKSNANTKELVSQFQAAMSNSGWQVETQEDANSATLRAKKGERSANVSIARGTEGMEIAVSYEGS